MLNKKKVFDGIAIEVVSVTVFMLLVFSTVSIVMR